MAKAKTKKRVSPHKVRREYQDYVRANQLYNRETGEPVPLPEDEVVWINDKYIVHRREFDNEQLGRMVHLSFTRRDRRPVVDWRDKQHMKNQLIGPDCDAVEIFPAEDRLVDQANQFHLWGFLQEDARLPFGFHQGRVVAENTDDYPGAVQRPLPVGTPEAVL